MLRAPVPKAAAIKVNYLGQTPVLSDAAWAEYQIRATGSPVEEVFRITEGGGTCDVLVDSVTSSHLVEAKYGDMGQMWIPDREAHIMRQADNYLKIADAFGYRGVGYAVSSELGAQRLLSRFTLDFPAEVSSGKLTAWWVP